MFFLVTKCVAKASNLSIFSENSKLKKPFQSSAVMIKTFCKLFFFISFAVSQIFWNNFVCKLNIFLLLWERTSLSQKESLKLVFTAWHSWRLGSPKHWLLRWMWSHLLQTLLYCWMFSCWRTCFYPILASLFSKQEPIHTYYSQNI